MTARGKFLCVLAVLVIGLPTLYIGLRFIPEGICLELFRHYFSILSITTCTIIAAS